MQQGPLIESSLGFLILSDQKQETLEEGFEELKKLLPEKAFAGRGAERGPELFMTDDDPVCSFNDNCVCDIIIIIRINTNTNLNGVI